MSFLYLNTGYAGLFSNSTFSESENSVYNPKNNAAVYNGHGMIPLSYKPKFICGKFDLYITSLSSLNIIISIGNELDNSFVIKISNQSISYQDKYNTANATDLITIDYDNSILNVNELNSLWFYILPIVDSKPNGIINLSLNDNIIVDVSDANFSFREKNIGIYSESNDVFLCNFILSDKEIEYYYEVFSLSSPIVSDVELNNELFGISQVDQKIIQTVDVENLISQYGYNADVLGISIAGISAYSNINDIGAFVSVEKNGSEYAVRKQFTLDTITSNYIIDSQFLNGTKLIGMRNKKYGWIAKA